MTGATAPCGVCQCTFGDTDCFHTFRYGDGPWQVEPTLDDDSDNLVECARSGLGAFLPSWVADPPCVHVYRTIDQYIGDEAAAGLLFNAERFDTDSMHSSGPADPSGNQPSRLTFKTAGVYLVTLNILWDKNEDGDRAAFIRRNGTDWLGIDALQAGNADLFVGQSVTITESFTAGDYVEALVQQDSGGTLAILVRRSSPNFSAMLLAPAP